MVGERRKRKKKERMVKKRVLSPLPILDETSLREFIVENGYNTRNTEKILKHVITKSYSQKGQELDLR